MRVLVLDGGCTRPPYRDGTFEQYVGSRGRQVHGLAQGRRDGEDVGARVIVALEPEDVVLGGGNVHQLETLPPGALRPRLNRPRQ